MHALLIRFDGSVRQAWRPYETLCKQVSKAAQAGELRKRAEEVSDLKFGRHIELQVGWHRAPGYSCMCPVDRSARCCWQANHV